MADTTYAVQDCGALIEVTTDADRAADMSRFGYRVTAYTEGAR